MTHLWLIFPTVTRLIFTQNLSVFDQKFDNINSIYLKLFTSNEVIEVRRFVILSEF